MTYEKLPILKPREVIAVIEKLGFVRKPNTGTSHARFIHPDGRRTMIAIHKGKDIKPEMLKLILHQIELTPEDFKKLL